MKEKTVPVTIRLTPSLRAKVQELADAERRTFSQYVALLLEKHVKADGKHKTIPDA